MTESTSVRDNSSICDKVVEHIENVSLVSLKDQKIGDDDNLFQTDVLDSYGLIELLLYLEQKFAFKLTEDELASSALSTVNEICAMVTRKTVAKSEASKSEASKPEASKSEAS